MMCDFGKFCYFSLVGGARAEVRECANSAFCLPKIQHLQYFLTLGDIGTSDIIKNKTF